MQNFAVVHETKYYKKNVVELAFWLNLSKQNRICAYLATGQLHPIVHEKQVNISNSR